VRQKKLIGTFYLAKACNSQSQTFPVVMFNCRPLKAAELPLRRSMRRAMAAGAERDQVFAGVVPQFASR